MKPAYKILLLLVVLALSAGAGIYWYAFMRPHQNMLKVSPEYKLNAKNLFSEFSDDETTANLKYLGKIVELTGKVAAVKISDNQTAVVLEDEFFGVRTYLDSAFCATNSQILTAINAGQTVTIRGQCDGILSDVVISRAVIIQ